jgi:hypothetical protein
VPKWPSMPLELNLDSLVLFILANLSTVCGPHKLSRNWKKSTVVPQSSMSIIRLRKPASFLHVLRNSAITFYTDNQKAAGIVLKGSKIYELQMIALSIFNTCMSNEIDIHTVWIPRIENQSRFSQSYYWHRWLGNIRCKGVYANGTRVPIKNWTRVPIKNWTLTVWYCSY